MYHQRHRLQSSGWTAHQRVIGHISTTCMTLCLFDVTRWSHWMDWLNFLSGCGPSPCLVFNLLGCFPSPRFFQSTSICVHLLRLSLMLLCTLYLRVLGTPWCTCLDTSSLDISSWTGDLNGLSSPPSSILFVWDRLFPITLFFIL